MLIKLDSLDFTFGRIERTAKVKKAITKADWVKIDRIVMAAMFLVAIIASLVF